MHTAYRIYNACCSLHFIICIIVLMAGFEGSFHFLTVSTIVLDRPPNANSGFSIFSLDSSWQHKENLTSNMMWRVSERGCSLSGPYFISCVSAALFSMIYLSLSSSHETQGEGAMMTSMMSSFYYHHMEQEQQQAEHHDVDAWSNMVMISEIIYWSFLISYSYVAIASNTLGLGSVELFYLRLLVHLFCLYTICSPTGKRKRVDITSSIAFVAFITETLVVISMAYTQTNIVVAYFHRFLDLLLILGHRWDSNPTWEVILNCRLFFVAAAGGLLHADILISSSHDSHYHVRA
jgi:hypothetical protein